MDAKVTCRLGFIPSVSYLCIYTTYLRYRLGTTGEVFANLKTNVTL